MPGRDNQKHKGGAICHYCGRSFRNLQAVRAHLKSCPDYVYTRNQPSEPKAAVPNRQDLPMEGVRERIFDDPSRCEMGTNEAKQTFPHPSEEERGITINQGFRYLLEVCEALEQLLSIGRDLLWWEKLAGRTILRSGEAGFQEWAELCRDIATVSQEAGRLFEDRNLGIPAEPLKHPASHEQAPVAEAETRQGEPGAKTIEPEQRTVVDRLRNGSLAIAIEETESAANSAMAESFLIRLIGRTSGSNIRSMDSRPGFEDSRGALRG